MGGPHEKMEHAEHAEHAAGHNKQIALLIAVLALFLAFSETLGKSAQTEGISAQHRGVGHLEFLPGQDHPPDLAAGRRRGDDVADRDGARRGEQGGDGQADRRLEEDRGALRVRAEGEGRPQGACARRPSSSSTSATPRWRATITTRSPRRRSRSASCWLGGGHHRHDGAGLCRRRRSACSGSPSWRIGLFAPHAVHLV